MCVAPCSRWKGTQVPPEWERGSSPPREDSLALRNGRANAMVSRWCLVVTKCNWVLRHPRGPSGSHMGELMEKTQ